MKNTKRISMFFVLLMALTTFLSMGVTAFAATTKGIQATLKTLDGTALNGTFELRDGSNAVVSVSQIGNGQYQVGGGSLTTMATHNGALEIRQTPYDDTYTLVQLSAETDYEKANSQSVHITANDVDIWKELHFVNSRIPDPIVEGKVRITVSDDAGNRMNGVVYGVFQSGTNTKLAELTTDSMGMALSGNLDAGSYYVKALNVPPTHTTGPDLSFAIANHGDLIDLSPVLTRIPRHGKILLTVTDGQNQPVVGAVYGIYDNASNVKQAELTLDASGDALSGQLGLGSYYLKQIRAQAGSVSDLKTPVQLVNDGETVHVRISNNDSVKRTKGRVRVTVTDGSATAKDPVYGVMMSVYKAVDNNKVADISTDASGIALSDELEAGSYYLKLTSIPSQFKQDKEKQIAFAIAADQVLDLSVVLERVDGKVKVLVKDEDGNPVSGASVTLYQREGDKKLSDVTTSTDGTANQGIAYGTYYAKLNSVPAGYTMQTDKADFTIDRTDEVTMTFTVKKQAGKLKLTVLGETDEIKLDGVVYGIFKKDGDTKVDEITTGTDGTAIKDLATGEYYLKLIKAKDGYALGEEKTSFTIESGKTTEITLKCTRLTGKIRVMVLDTEDNEVEGVTVNIVDAEGNSMGEVTTDDNGQAMTDALPLGTYTLNVKKVPEGYKLNKKDKRTVLLDSSKQGGAEFVIEAVKGTLILQYRHVDTQAELEKEFSYTDFVGRDYMSWLRNSGHDRKALTGYTFVRADYPAETKLIDGTLTITYWYGGSGSGSGIGNSGGTISSGINTSIPKTGEVLPVANYVIGSLSTVLGGVFIALRKCFSR